MNVPEGYTEERVLKIIDGILDYLAPNFTFGYYDVDDIKQEGRIFALEVLSKCTPGVEINNFLFTHIKNRLINLKRNKLTRPNPCNRCKECKYDCINNCPRYNKWIKRSLVKKNLTEAHAELTEQHTDYRKEVEQLHDTELLKIVDNHLPPSFRHDFLRLIEGCTIPQFRRSKLVEEINSIVKQYYPGGYYDEDDE